MNLKNIWDSFTDRYSYLFIHPQYFVKKYTNNSIEMATKYASGTLLDIGCGRMPYKNKFLPFIKKYIGLDHPEVAKLYKGKEKPDILADTTKVPLPNGSCDTITCFQVLEHLPDPSKGLEEMNRILQKNGRIIISTIQFYPLHDEPHDYYRFTKYGLSHLLKQSGFVVLKHKSDGNVFTLIFQSINIYLMTILKGLAKQDLGKVLAFCLAPFFLAITTTNNLLTLPFLSLDRNSSFRIIHTVVAKKK